MQSHLMSPDPAASELETLLWRLPVAVFRSTPGGRFLAGNPRLLELFGADSMEQLLELDVRDLYVDPAARDHMISRVAAGHELEPEEVHFRRLDDSEIWVRVSSRSVTADDGSILYIEGVLEDVSARREGELRLTESNLLLDAVTTAQNRFLTGEGVGEVFDDLLEILLSLTASEYGFIAKVLGTGSGRFLRSMAMSNIAWNDETRDMFERLGPRGMEFHNLDTMFGRVVTDTEPVVSNDPRNDPRSGGRPYGHPPLDSFLGLPVLKGENVIGVVALANRPGGYTEDFARSLQPFLSTVGSILDAIQTRQARSAAEERERTRDRRFRSVIDAAVDAVIVFDDQGTIEAFNPAAQQLFGYREDEVIGTDVGDLFTTDLLDERDGVPSTSVRIPEEVTLRHRSGDDLPGEISIGSFELDGRVTITAVIRDITERKVTEDALRRAKESAERASRSKDEFLAGMSHELRTPLNGVIGLSSILERGTHGALNEKQGQYVAQIGESGKHLLSLINDVLDLAKIEADHLEPELDVVQLENLIDQSVGIVGEAALSKSVSLTAHVPAMLPPVTADARRTRQVLVNLLGNAIKFTPSGGRVEVAAHPDGPHVVVSVTDTGIGIPADRLEDVFVPFQQVDASLDRRHEGTGLGLALSKRMIEVQRGTMAVTSAIGEGSRFEFRLPIAAVAGSDEHEAADAAVASPPEVRQSRVLVVEDNDVNRMLISDYLEAHRIDVVTAQDGDEAITRALSASPDVILMDIQMPRRDGLSATQELKRREETGHIPVIALTALAMKGDAERCLAAGCDEYISKPCDPATVLEVVRRHLAPR